MVHAQAGYFSSFAPAENRLVSGGKDFGQLHSQCDQTRDVEETAVIDQLGSQPPISQTIMLLLEHIIEAVERSRPAGLPIVLLQNRSYAPPRRLFSQRLLAFSA